MKKTKLVMTLTFVLLIGGLTIASAIVKDRKFSENENRYLSSFPELTWDNFISGEFQNGLEEYLKDHIVGRDQWTGGRTAATQLLGGCDVGGAYIGKEGYLFEKVTPGDVDEKLVASNMKAVKKYFDSLVGTVDEECMSFMLVPTAAGVMDKMAPNYAILFDQDSYIDEAADYFINYNFVDVRDSLEAVENQPVYYKTDHHWTTLGAYHAYRGWCQRTNHVIWSQDYFEITQVSDSFKGSLFSKVLNMNSAKDIVERYDRKDMNEYCVIADGVNSDSFYHEEWLDKKDKYAYFFGGNYAEVSIEKLAVRDDNAAERNLLVIKDSFANSFIPFIAAEYDNIYMVDLRYYSGDMVAYAKSHEITDVLVLYNISNFVSDRNIRKLGVSLPSSDIPVEPEPSPEPVPNPSPDPEPVPQPQPSEEPIPVISTDIAPVTSGNLVIFGDKGFEMYSYKEDMGNKYASGINSLAASLSGRAKVYDLIVPLGSGIMMPDAYQTVYDTASQPKAITALSGMMSGDVTFVNVYNTLMHHRDEYLYYRTDHHWTALGAYYAYTDFCRSKGIEPIALDAYETINYEGFLGSLYTESKAAGMKDHPDTVTAYVPISDSEMTITDIYGNVTKESVLANGTTIPTSDKYCVYIHGDHPISDVVNKELHDGSACIVVKESYGNSFVPFLIEHYEHVYVVDYRYWTGNLSALVDETGATDVLFINNLYAVRNQYLLGKLLGLIYE